MGMETLYLLRLSCWAHRVDHGLHTSENFPGEEVSQLAWECSGLGHQPQSVLGHTFAHLAQWWWSGYSGYWFHPRAWRAFRLQGILWQTSSCIWIRCYVNHVGVKSNLFTAWYLDFNYFPGNAGHRSPSSSHWSCYYSIASRPRVWSFEACWGCKFSIFITSLFQLSLTEAQTRVIYIVLI